MQENFTTRKLDIPNLLSPGNRQGLMYDLLHGFAVAKSMGGKINLHHHVQTASNEIVQSGLSTRMNEFRQNLEKFEL